MTEKSRENKLRRTARKKGYYATKGKDACGGDGWMILDRHNNIAIAGYSPEYSMSLEEAEAFVYGE